MLRSAIIAGTMLFLIGYGTARESALFRAGGAKESDDRAKIVERLRVRYQDVLDQLNKNDPGADTLAMQKEIAELLKRLLEQDDSPQGNSPPPSNPPPSAKDPPPAPKPAPMNAQPEPKNAPPSPVEKASPVRGETERAAKSFEEMKKQLEKDGHWPLKVPARHRVNIDVSGSGRFMPRYEELLRAYYRTIAESKRADDDK